MSQKSIFKPPDAIYLQVVGTDDTAAVEETYSAPFNEIGEITWCSDKINDSDLEYRLVKRKRRK